MDGKPNFRNIAALSSVSVVVCCCLSGDWSKMQAKESKETPKTENSEEDKNMHFGPWAYVCASTDYTKKGPEILMRRC